MNGVREAILNALVHRDYSLHTEGSPISLCMYSDRMEVVNKGGLYGRISVDLLGKVHPETRNPALVDMMEVMGITENRYSGVPTMRREMRAFGLPRRLPLLCLFEDYPEACECRAVVPFSPRGAAQQVAAFHERAID